ncbi:MAG TPA: sarcosine oxidase subunit gamma family protein [Steroidobacteraceae bacterium]|nr:sarcosine oxidase subunit gamma family protein [Steroidobacteraceae bacterium]
MADTAMRRVPAIPSTGWLQALPPALRLVLHGDARARALALPHWGAGFSEAACRAIVNGTRATLWLGPDEYLLLDSAPGAQPAAAIEAIERALVDAPHALVDISHRQFALEINGPHASAILNGACPLDLDPSEFPIGMCTRTVFAKADIVLWRTRADAFHLEVWRSFSGYVTGVIGEIAKEFYGHAG